MDDFTDVTYEVDHGLAWITINRPDRYNSFRARTVDELVMSFKKAWGSDEVGVIALTGTGEKAFCTGGDQKQRMETGDYGPSESGLFEIESLHRVIRDVPKPVIAAVNGYAMGGGLEIALACHLVVADATAQFALSEVKVGLIAGAGGLVRLPRTVPPKVATEMILTGRRITASEALGYGLVNRVTEPAGALDGARALAAEILDGSPTSVRLSLRVMAETRGIPDVIDAVTHTSSAVDELMISEDMIEGVTAFAAKRPPRWRSR
jgi:acetyl-CoA C-acetyltransferase